MNAALVRISPEALRLAKSQAALEGVTLKAWLDSLILRQFP